MPFMRCAWRTGTCVTAPVGTELQRELALLGTAREHEYRARRIQVFGQLQHEVARPAEAGQPERRGEGGDEDINSWEIE